MVRCRNWKYNQYYCVIVRTFRFEFCVHDYLHIATYSTFRDIRVRKYSRYMSMIWDTDYERPMMPFFRWNPKLLNLGRQIGQISFGAFGEFSAELLSTHFGTVSPLSIFSIIQSLFLKKTKLLYSHPKYLFGIGIWIWATKKLGIQPLCVRSPWFGITIAIMSVRILASWHHRKILS